MQKIYKEVIFDLDGTILDTSEGVLAAVKYAIEQHGLNMPDGDGLQRFIGPPIQKTFQKMYQVTEEKANEFAATFRNRYKDFDLLKATAYEGIFELFKNLVSLEIRPAIATYKRQDYTDILMAYYGFDKYTDIIYGADFAGKLSKSDIIKLCIEKANISDYKEVMMVGDTLHDAGGANELDVDFVGVTYGFGFKSREEVERYPCIGAIDKPLELLSYIEGEKDNED